MRSSPRRIVAILAALALAPLVLPRPAAAATDAAAAFDRIKALAGTWSASVPDMPVAATVSYRVTAGGSAIIETLFEGSPHEMVSVYFREGDELRMTHYCAMGNQPRLRLDPLASTADRLVFVFDGGTGFRPRKDSHVHEGFLDFSAGEAVKAEWAWWNDGREGGRHRLAMTRVE